MIIANKDKCNISAMCRTLHIPRSLVYYKKKARVHNTKLENAVIAEFRASKNNYGSRKIKNELAKQNVVASRRKIRKIMDKYRLVSNYTIKQYKVHKTSCNEDKTENIVNREFDNRRELEIVGYSAGAKKDASLVYETFMNTNINLTKVYFIYAMIDSVK